MKFICALFALIIVTTPVMGQDFDAGAFDSTIDTALSEWGTPGAAVAIIADGEVVHLKGYGALKSGLGRPVDPDTVFAIGSNGKSFTAVLLGTLADEGLLRFSDPLAMHVPGFTMLEPYAAKQVNFLDALGHRSGLGEQSGLAAWYLFGRDRPTMISLIGQMPEAHGFRSSFAYNNAMFVVAGTAAEAVTGKDYETLVDERILQPLGMKRSGASLATTRIDDNVATPHHFVGGVATPVPYHDVSGAAPAGSMNSTARDMSQFVRMLIGMGTVDGIEVLEPETATAIQRLRHNFTPTELVEIQQLFSLIEQPDRVKVLGYGLGLAVMVYGDTRFVMHGGSIDGMTSWMAWSPERKIGYLCLTNASNMFLPFALMFEAINPLLNLPPDHVAARLMGLKDAITNPPGLAPPANPAPPVSSAAVLVGRYSNIMGALLITHTEHRLRITTWPSGYEGDLMHHDADVYRVKWDNPAQVGMTVRFDRHMDGTVGSLTASEIQGPKIFALAPQFDKEP